jgi:hypothetical protein
MVRTLEAIVDRDYYSITTDTELQIYADGVTT